MPCKSGPMELLRSITLWVQRREGGKSGSPPKFARACTDHAFGHIPVDILPIKNRRYVGIQHGSSLVASNFNQERLIGRLTSAFGLLSLILASVGLYGVMSYIVDSG